MRSFFLFICLCLISSTLAANKYSLVVYGATPAGIAAALAAADTLKNNITVLVLEPSANIGGMLTAGGIGLRDLDTVGTMGGLAKTWTMLNAKDYGVDYPVYQPDMPIGLKNLNAMISQRPNVKVLINAPLAETKNAVVKSGTKIISIVTAGNYPGQVWEADQFIDASYDGDLTRAAGASYTFGRESRSQYDEAYAGVQGHVNFGNFLENSPVSSTYTNGTLIPYVSSNPLGNVGSADDKLQAYSYRLCITKNKANQAPFPKPANYNPDHFILLQRYIDSLVQSGKYPNGPPFNFLVDVLNYRNYPPADKYDMCDSQSAFTSDAVDLNAGYVLGSYAQRKEIEANHYYYVAGLLTYLSTDSKVPSYTRESTLAFGLCKDQWTNNGFWPQQLYIREGLRLVGDRVITQNDLVGGKCTNDSIGVGSWVIDIHVVQRIEITDPKHGGAKVVTNEGQMMTPNKGSQAPYDLSYSLLLPKRSELTNLLVPVCNSASHVAYGSIRVEPTFMQLGQASGVAASLALQDKVDVQSVNITTLQNILKNQGIYLHWPVNSCQ